MFFSESVEHGGFFERYFLGSILCRVEHRLCVYLVSESSIVNGRYDGNIFRKCFLFSQKYDTISVNMKNTPPKHSYQKRDELMRENALLRKKLASVEHWMQREVD